MGVVETIIEHHNYWGDQYLDEQRGNAQLLSGGDAQFPASGYIDDGEEMHSNWTEEMHNS